jgi:hypothetical protein
MHTFLLRLALLPAALVVATASAAFAQSPSAAVPSPSTADPEKPVTPPDSYRVVMENERVRIVEINIKAHSKVNVDSPANRERFLYMLSDGALILAPPGKTPYEFALHAGETAVFPAVSPTVENDTDAPVRALMLEVKEGTRIATGGKSRHAAKRGAHGKRYAKMSAGKSSRSKASRTASRSKGKVKHAARTRTTTKSVSTKSKPLNLDKANARPGKKVTGKKSRGSDG